MSWEKDFVKEHKHGHQYFEAAQDELGVAYDDVFDLLMEDFFLRRKREIETAFTVAGNFALDGFTPYNRYSTKDTPHCAYAKEYEKVYDALFVDGKLKTSTVMLLPQIINEHQWTWECDAVRCHYAEEHGKQTAGSYPACYMWR